MRIQNTTLMCRLTSEEKALLLALVAQRQTELADEGVRVTATAVIRQLIRKAAAEAGVKVPSKPGKRG